MSHCLAKTRFPGSRCSCSVAACSSSSAPTQAASRIASRASAWRRIAFSTSSGWPQLRGAQALKDLGGELVDAALASGTDGVPTSIKDALWTRGWPTLRGSWLIDEAGAWDEDAPSVARLRETGAVLLGKTTTPEYS